MRFRKTLTEIAAKSTKEDDNRQNRKQSKTVSLELKRETASGFTRSYRELKQKQGRCNVKPPLSAGFFLKKKPT
jgi:hypothetical protein